MFMPAIAFFFFRRDGVITAPEQPVASEDSQHREQRALKRAVNLNSLDSVI